MPIIHKKIKNEGRFEERKDLKKLCFHVTIVPSGQAPVINKLFKTLGVACQFSQKGRGTASKRVREILGLEENYKDCIIWAETSNVEDLKAAIKKALSLDNKERERIIALGKQKVMERTSVEHIGQLLHDLII